MYVFFFALWFLCSRERMWPNSNQGIWKRNRTNSYQQPLNSWDLTVIEEDKEQCEVLSWHWQWCADQVLLLSLLETLIFTGSQLSCSQWSLSWSKASPSRVWPSLCSKNLKDEFFLMDTCYTLVIMISSNNDMSAVHDSQLWHFKKELYWGIIDTLVNCLN